MAITRRQFLKGAMATGIGLALPLKFGVKNAMAAAYSPNLTKWIQPMRGLGPTGIPVLSSQADPFFTAAPAAQFFQVTVGEFTDQLHPALGPTRLWGYWDTTNPVKRHLGGIIAVPRNTPARLRFTNKLPTRHIIPVDATLPGANQAQNRTAVHLHGGLIPWISDGGPFDWWTPGGPAYANGMSFVNGPGGVLDNIAAQRMVPGQADFYYPNNQSTRLLWYHDHAHGTTRINAYAGIATGYLIFDPAQETALAAKIPAITPTTLPIPLIYQDKTFVNAATIGATDPTWATVARSDCQSTGSLWYQHIYDPAVSRLLVSPTRLLTPPNPSCIPEYFGDTPLMNGLVYPTLTVQPKTYRFIMLNASNARVLNMNLFKADGTADGITLDVATQFPVNVAGPPIIQIGTEGGYLPHEVTFTTVPAPAANATRFNVLTLTGNLFLAPAERADFLIDFTGVAAGTSFILYNDAPAPFPVGDPGNDYYLGNPLNPTQPLAGTGPDSRQILKITVAGTATAPIPPRPVAPVLPVTTFMDPVPLAALPAVTLPLTGNSVIPPLAPPANIPVRNLTLNETFDTYGRLEQRMGTTTPGMVSKGFGLAYLDPPTEVINNNATEVWRIFNLTGDTHPIHFHLINLQILSRQPFQLLSGRFTPGGIARGPDPNELGWKETIRMHPGEVITVIAQFSLPTPLPFVVPTSPRATATGGFGMGLAAPAAGQAYHEYVYHCHILEHEEHDMMRPMVVVG